jgi:hypothetical protein
MTISDMPRKPLEKLTKKELREMIALAENERREWEDFRHDLSRELVKRK